MKLGELLQRLEKLSPEAKEFDVVIFRSSYQERIGDYPLSDYPQIDWIKKKFVLFAENDK